MSAINNTVADAVPLLVPRMGRELQFWHPDASYLSRTRRTKETGEYYSAVPAHIAGCEFGIPEDVGADLEESAAALGRLDAYAGARLGMRDRVLGPMSAILLRTESTSSSQIENLTVGAKGLALQELGQGRGGNAEVVVGNVRAMEAALGLAKKLDEPGILAMHAALLSVQSGFEQYAGRYRDVTVWIGGSSYGPRGASHVGPQPELIEACMGDLMAFLHRDDLPVILQCAVAHAQFETIHPFVDSNGRVGRALVHAILRNKGLVSNVTPPVSAGLLTDTGRYFRALGSYRDGDARPIVECFTDACRYASVTGIRLIDALEEQIDLAREALRGVRSDAAVWGILPLLIEQPIVNHAYLMSKASISPATARRVIDVLVERGVLTEIMGGRRNKVWAHQGILQVLDEYAKQLRRV